MAGTLFDDRQVKNVSALSSSITSSANATLDTILGLIDTRMATLSSSQTLTNKVLTGNTAVNLISGSGTLVLNTTGTATVPNATDTLVGRATTDTLTNKTLAFLQTSVANDSTTGANATLAAFTTGVVRLTNVSLTSVSGIPAGSAGQVITIENQTGVSITVNNDEATASAANRIYTGSGSNATMPNNASFQFTYDATATHWMLIGGTGSGSGSGGLNYILNPNAESDTVGWNAYADERTVTITNASPAVFTISSTTGYYVGMPISFSTSAAALPAGLTASTTYYISNVVSGTTFRVSLTRGGVDINTSSAGSGTHTARPLVPVSTNSSSSGGLTFSRNTTTPLRGTADFKLAQTNATIVAGQGVYAGITIDSADKAKILSVQFDFNASSTFSAADGVTAPGIGGAGDSDIEWFIRDNTNSVNIPLTPQVITANGANNYTFKAVFQSASNSTSYRLCAHVSKMSANATGWTFNFDNVSVGPQAIVQGPPVLDWTPYTLAIGATTTAPTFGTITVNNAAWRRVGDSMEIQYSFVQTSGGTAGTGVYLFPLPTGYSIDTTKFDTTTSSATSSPIVGNGQCGNTNALDAATVYMGQVSIRNSTNLFMSLKADGSNTNMGFSAANAGFFGGACHVTFFARVPIAGWSSTVLMSNDSDTRVVDLVAYNSAGSTTANTNIAGWTSLKDSHAAFNGTTFTVPVSGDYLVNYIANTTSGNPVPQIAKNGTLYAQGTSGSSSTGSVQVIVFGLKAGDTINPQLANSLTFVTSTVNTIVSISKLSGPSAIAATESVNGRYFSSVTTITGSLATILYATKSWDSHGAYNAATGIWTCPSSGKYLFNAAIATAGTIALNSALDLQVQQSGSSSQISEDLIDGAAGLTNLSTALSDEFYCLAGDTIKVQVSSTATAPTVVSSNSRNYFSWSRVGN